MRDDSGKHRVYRDEEEREYHSVTSILKHTAPADRDWETKMNDVIQLINFVC